MSTQSGINEEKSPQPDQPVWLWPPVFAPKIGIVERLLFLILTPPLLTCVIMYAAEPMLGLGTYAAGAMALLIAAWTGWYVSRGPARWRILLRILWIISNVITAVSFCNEGMATIRPMFG